MFCGEMKIREALERDLDYLFEIAKKQNKPVHVHIDQENNPNERDTDKKTLVENHRGYNSQRGKSEWIIKAKNGVEFLEVP